MITAVAIDVTWGVLGIAASGLAIGGGVIGFVAWKARTMYLKLQGEQAAAISSQQQAESSYREKLLASYKEMYEIEKERGNREIADLRNQISLLREELQYMTNRQKEIQEEAERLRNLNVKYQEDKRLDQHTIANLQQQVENLKREVEALKAGR